MTFLEKLIKDKGLILSGEILEILTSKEKGISKEAARKRLSRIGESIYRVRGLFADGQILFHDKDIFGTEEYYDGLHRALKKAGKQYYTIIQSLDFHNGYIKSDHLAAYAVNPVEKLKGHLTFETTLRNLLKIGLVHLEDEHVVVSNSISKNSHSLKRAKGLEVAKNFLLMQFNDWSRKIGLVSYNSSKFHSEFGKYQFNFVAPSYVGSLTKKTSDSIVPAFVIADILIGNVINENQVNFFINKISALKQQRGLAKFIPFLIVDSIDTKALNNLKSKGAVIGFADELFGENYKELLNSLINLITNAGAILKKKPEAYLDLISKLNKLVDGKTNNLRGDLFELAVGYYQGRICSSIDIGKLINHSGERREIDVFGLQPNRVLISECKGYNHPISKEEIEVWLGEKVPVIRKWVLDNATISDKELVFQFWSTGGFTQEALELLEKRIESTKKYTIEYFDLDKMLEISKKINSKKFTEILREYYIKEI
ncbi:hypothetical protein [Plebeiibacterium sediminum]|uniref:Uncharacterized protein n=1 Tax=Plebeiibacterium sediminum TaxID=2992112 RepID=A0AAE3M9H0_9BACT|nr:hypothetical protein [Plebeiobacterium sediminum]MCW3789427.1 hypothetical protein [Plebeiobacterium sediminum]